MASLHQSLFNAQWYLSHNADVADAVERGETTALEHFEMYGKSEGRSAGPLFNATQYLDDNPDVAEAVERGETTAYDHFVQHGASEGRSPLSFFDVGFYLDQNPDVAAAVQAGETTAAAHLLMFGLGEGRQVTPFLNLDGYLKANTDVAAAVEQGETDPLTHLLQYGIAEGRLLSNGVDLGFFANDPGFTSAIAEGDFEAAFARVAEVAPFLPTFQAPAGWSPASDTPIPQGFVPPAGQYLKVPESVEVPADTTLPDAFGPTPAPSPGGGGTPAGRYSLTTDDDIINGTAGADVFHATMIEPAGITMFAPHLKTATLNDGDKLDGKGGRDVLNIDLHSYDDGVAPTLRNIEVINNSNVAAFFPLGRDAMPSGPALDLSNTTGLQELWTDFSGMGPGGIGSGVYRNASLDTTFGVRGVDGNMTASINVGLANDLSGFDDTLKLSLQGPGGTVDVNWNNNTNTNTGIEDLIVKAETNNKTSLGLADNATLRTITVTGSGELGISVNPFGSSSALSNLRTLDASAATGKITAGLESTRGLTSVKLGSGDDALTVESSTIANSAAVVRGGAGRDTLNILSTGATDIKAGIEGFEVIKYQFSTPTPDPSGIDASKFLGATEIWQVNHDTNVYHIGEGQTIGLENTDGEILLSYLDDVKNATVEFKNVTPKVSGATVLFSGSDLETVSISGSVSSDDSSTPHIQLTATTVNPPGPHIVDTLDISTLNVSLSTAAKISLINFDKLKTFDASGSTGDITAQLKWEGLETVTLGEGSDTIQFNNKGDALGNISLFPDETGNLADVFEGKMISIIDFNGSNDALSFSSGSLHGPKRELNETEAAEISDEEALYDAVALAAVKIGENQWGTFQFGDNSYIFQNNDTAEFDFGDGLIEIIDFTGAFNCENLIGGYASV